MKYWHVWLQELQDIKTCQHIVLQKDQYLLDVLNDCKDPHDCGSWNCCLFECKTGAWKK